MIINDGQMTQVFLKKNGVTWVMMAKTYLWSKGTESLQCYCLIYISFLWPTGICIRYSTIETKEVARFGYNGFLRWRQRCIAPRPSPEYEWGKRNPLYPIRANSFVSIIMYHSVVEKINGMAYIFTLLMFRKPNKTTINNNKTTNVYRSTSFRFSFIFRYFKVFQVKIIVYI